MSEPGTIAATAVPAEAEFQPLSRAKVGMACLILTEISFFATFVVGYLFYLGQSKTGPQPGAVLGLPLLATACLLSSSATITLAVRALRSGAAAQFTTLWGATLALGIAFLIATAREWSRLIGTDGLTIATNLFGTTYYGLVGLHATHVTVGALLLAIVLLLSLRGLVTAAHTEKIEMLAWYWHFVDVVWVVVFTVVYVVGR